MGDPQLWISVKRWLKNQVKAGKPPKRAPVFLLHDVQYLVGMDVGLGMKRQQLAIILGIYGRLRNVDYCSLEHKNINIFRGIFNTFF